MILILHSSNPGLCKTTDLLNTKTAMKFSCFVFVEFLVIGCFKGETSIILNAQTVVDCMFVHLE